MEYTPPPPPQQITSQMNCQWCSKPMPADATNCPSCGKLRRDIYTEKVRSYLFCLAGGIFIATFFILKKKSQPQMNYYNFYDNNNSGSNTFAYVVLALGIISAIVGTWYYIRVSQKLKTWLWV